jgi:hypothetical protein
VDRGDHGEAGRVYHPALTFGDQHFSTPYGRRTHNPFVMSATLPRCPNPVTSKAVNNGSHCGYHPTRPVAASSALAIGQPCAVCNGRKGPPPRSGCARSESACPQGPGVHCARGLPRDRLPAARRRSASEGVSSVSGWLIRGSATGALPAVRVPDGARRFGSFRSDAILAASLQVVDARFPGGAVDRNVGHL